MKKYWVIFTLLVLTGCSSKLAYNNLDWLIYWYMDDYVELTDSQKAIFDSKLDSWIDWHRREQLALYREQLKQVIQDIQQDRLTKAVIAEHLNQANAHIMTVRAKITPELASLASRLNDEQVVYLFAAIQKENDKEQQEIDDYNALSAQEKLNKRIDNAEEQFEERLGKLTSAQRALIANSVTHYTSTRENWLAYRLTMQNEARKLFAGRRANPEFEQQLTHLLNNPDDYRSLKYIADRQANRDAYLTLASKLAATITDKQKSHLIKNLQDIVDDISDLQDD